VIRSGMFFRPSCDYANIIRILEIFKELYDVRKEEALKKESAANSREKSSSQKKRKYQAYADSGK